MAFYNRKMMQNKEIIKAWRAGHRRKIHSDEEISLPEICGEIGHWMRRDRHPRNRLSLRSFSVLLSGAIRLYRDQINLLLKDTFKCSISPVSVFTPVDHTISESSVEELTEFMPGIEATNTRENNSSENGYPPESTEYNTDTESLPPDDSYETIADDDSTVFTVTSKTIEQTYSEEQDASEKTRDQMIQTSPAPSDNFTNFDPNLPFGYIIVHDNFHSRIPSKILFSSLSENARFLPIHRPML
ncbi:uncharacterized protein LOC134800310 [Cydia splendana]|uniref:uncharacterized protein LOC134800310 n=1 Tax=Cydia splendana TaxID=1100963 RepID=UPI00300C991A